jgi:hypothetical protein
MPLGIPRPRILHLRKTRRKPIHRRRLLIIIIEKATTESIK